VNQYEDIIDNRTIKVTETNSPSTASHHSVFSCFAVSEYWSLRVSISDL
jgi:hypothetical protein